MRAIEVPRFGPPEVLEVVERPVPEPGPGQVAISVSHAGVNFAEVKTRVGAYGDPGVLPVVPGLEVTGTITAVGEGVTRLSMGERVVAFTKVGGYAEVVLATEALTVPVPEQVPPEVAAALPTILPTALFLVDEVARLRKDETVLVHAAAGGVGTMLGQLATAKGARTVLGTVGSQDKVAYASRFGYDEVVVREAFPGLVDAASGGRGVDVVFDSVGGATRAASFEALARLGRVVCFGNASGEPEVLPGGDVFRSRNQGALGFSIGSLSGADPERVREVTERAVGLVADGKATIDVTDVLPLEQAAEAHRRLESRTTRGKLVLAMA